MKKTLTTIALALVLSNVSFGGIMVSDREGILVSDKSASSCAAKGGILVSDRTVDGIIIFDRTSAIVSGIVSSLMGVLIADKGAQTCTASKDGILVSDRAGILVSD